MAQAKADNGIVNIHGRAYQTVALRVSMFRDKHPDWALVTEVLHRDLQCVVMQARVMDETGRVLATGHSEEFRESSQINRTSALENAETSAIGRALAGLGYGGTEFATADEVANAITSKPQAPVVESRSAGDAEALGVEVTDEDRLVASLILGYWKKVKSGVRENADGEDLSWKAWELYEPLTADRRVAVWHVLRHEPRKGNEQTVRGWIKQIGEEFTKEKQK